jgi:hypothetical protein
MYVILFSCIVSSIVPAGILYTCSGSSILGPTYIGKLLHSSGIFRLFKDRERGSIS